jgi:molybdopterin/thiamine biosynthesis adenylyltransferase
VILPGRYSRQELFAGIGRDGQRRLRDASVVVVGCGALGSVLAEQVVRAGVGRVLVVDRDYVEASNLQRQSLFDEADAEAGTPKAVAAQAKLRRLNSDVEVTGVVADLASDNAVGLLAGASLVLDGTDNFETRFLLNDLCVRSGTPWVYGACVSAHGLVLAIRPGVSPCLRCVLDEMPAPGSGPTCDTAGVIAPIVHVVAGVQAAEALKLLTGRHEDLLPGLFTVDLWRGQFDVMDLAGQAPWCPACTQGRFDHADRPRAEAVLCGRDAVQIPGSGGAIDLSALGARLAPLGEVKSNEHLLRFRSADADLVVFKDGRALVKGVHDAAQARSLYARYVGA